MNSHIQARWYLEADLQHSQLVVSAFACKQLDARSTHELLGEGASQVRRRSRSPAGPALHLGLQALLVIEHRKETWNLHTHILAAAR